MSDEKSRWVKQAVSQFEVRLVRYTASIVPEANAREIVQETFLRLWQEEMPELEGRLAEWLFAVCRNQAIDFLRRESHRAKVSGDLTFAPVLTPEERTFRSQQRRTLMDMVKDLSAEKQEVIRLKFQEDLSYKEISAITGHSISYVGVLIHTAMAEMRERIEDDRE